MEVALTKNGGLFDKGCPGERLKSATGKQSPEGLCASQWFGSGQGPLRSTSECPASV
jgi:hypothetical protein